MSKLGTFLKVGALACAMTVATQSFADVTFKVPVHYSVKLVDGKDSDFGYNRFNRTITMAPGRHQLVFLFEGAFGTSRDSRFVQAGNPIVVEIPNMPDNASYTFDYTIPTDEYTAERFSRSQRVTLIDANTKAPLTAEQANYYILTSDSGFAILRDYRDDLASVGRLYAPQAVLDELNKNKGVAVANEAGVATVRAHTGAANYSNVAAPAAATAAAAVPTVQANSKGPSAQSAVANSATYEQLVNIYENADDATKLKFVKYILAN